MPEDEYAELIHAQMTKIVRLSESECAALSLDELETIDRSQNYVLPNSYKRKVEEYRKVYKIPSPEEVAKERRLLMDQQRLKKAKEKYEKKRLEIEKQKLDNQTQQEDRNKASHPMSAFNFDFDAKYNKNHQPKVRDYSDSAGDKQSDRHSDHR